MLLPFILPFLLQVGSTFSLANSCKNRNYGYGSVVCVCDERYCDTVPPIEPFAATDEAVVFISDKGGRRFERTIVPRKKSDKKAASVNIVVEPTKKYQAIEGFGGTITDSSAMHIINASSKLQDALFQAYFGKHGIEYNMLRVPIAGCDGSTRVYTYDEVKDDFKLKHFALVEEDIKYKIPVLQKAQKYASSPILLSASSWSAPTWMKANGRVNGSASLKGSPTKTDRYYNTWAKYHVRFLEEYAKHGVKFWTITPQNEPTIGWPEGSGGWQTQVYTTEMQRDFIKYNLGPTLHKSPFKNVTIMILDDDRRTLLDCARKLLNDSEVRKYVSHVAVHYYYDKVVPDAVQDTIHDEYPNIPILYTEASHIHKTVFLGSWEDAENYADDIITNLNHWATGWIDWGIVYDTNGGPSWMGNIISSPIIMNATANEFYKLPTFYALGHFSKFLPRGSYRIGRKTTAHQSNKEQVLRTAFQTQSGYRVVILLNKKNDTVDVSVSEEKKTMKVTLPPLSIATVLWK